MVRGAHQLVRPFEQSFCAGSDECHLPARAQFDTAGGLQEPGKCLFDRGQSSPTGLWRSDIDSKQLVAGQDLPGPQCRESHSAAKVVEPEPEAKALRHRFDGAVAD